MTRNRVHEQTLLHARRRRVITLKLFLLAFRVRSPNVEIPVRADFAAQSRNDPGIVAGIIGDPETQFFQPPPESESDEISPERDEIRECLLSFRGQYRVVEIDGEVRKYRYGSQVLFCDVARVRDLEVTFETVREPVIEKDTARIALKWYLQVIDGRIIIEVVRKDKLYRDAVGRKHD